MIRRTHVIKSALLFTDIGVLELNKLGIQRMLMTTNH